jgi:predicted DNA-binding protein YlxM (UPF0122 family)
MRKGESKYSQYLSEWLLLYVNDHTLQAIADKYEVSKLVVHDRLKDHPMYKLKRAENTPEKVVKAKPNKEGSGKDHNDR